jgi:hypothetical protein
MPAPPPSRPTRRNPDVDGLNTGAAVAESKRGVLALEHEADRPPPEPDPPPNTKICDSCHAALPREAYSSSQWTRKPREQRRCKICIEAETGEKTGETAPEVVVEEGGETESKTNSDDWQAVQVGNGPTAPAAATQSPAPPAAAGGRFAGLADSDDDADTANTGTPPGTPIVIAGQRYHSINGQPVTSDEDGTSPNGTSHTPASERHTTYTPPPERAPLFDGTSAHPASEEEKEEEQEERVSFESGEEAAPSPRGQQTTAEVVGGTTFFTSHPPPRPAQYQGRVFYDDPLPPPGTTAARGNPRQAYQGMGGMPHGMGAYPGMGGNYGMGGELWYGGDAPSSSYVCQ